MSNFRKSILIFGAILLIIGAALATFLVLSFSGSLVTDPIELVYQIADEKKDYDGEPLLPQECLLMSGTLVEGHTASIALEGEQTAAGESRSGAKITVLDENGFDVTGEYKIRVEGGRLTVNRQEIYILLSSAQVVYSGDKVVFHDYSVVMGSLANGHSIGARVAGTGVVNVGDTLDRNDVFPAIYDANGRNVTANYEPMFAMSSTVEVVARPITLKPASAEKTYDGEPLVCPNTEIAAGTLVTGHYCKFTYWNELDEEATLTDAGEMSFRVSARVYDPLGNDVTSNYAIDDSATATLKVTKRALTVTGASRSWEYDGNAHSYYPTAATEEVEPASAEGLAAGESVRVVYSGTITELGERENAIERCRVLDKNGFGDTSANYEITYIHGTLSVTKTNLTVALKRLNKEFDGAPYRAADPNAYYEFSPALPEDVRFTSNVEAALAQTITGDAQYTFTDYAIAKAEKDVTAYYNVTVVSGTVTIAPKRAILTTDLSGVVQTEYSGAPCAFPRDRFKVSGLLSGHAISSVTGDRVLYPAQEVQKTALGGLTITDASGRDVSRGYELAGFGDIEISVLVSKKKTAVTVSDYTCEYGETITPEFLKTLISCESPFTAADFSFGTNPIGAVGEYPLIPEYAGEGFDYYEPKITTGTLTIVPKKIAVRVSGGKIYDGAPLSEKDLKLECGALPEGITAKPAERVLQTINAGVYRNAEIVFYAGSEPTNNYEAVVTGAYEIEKRTAYLKYADLGEKQAPKTKTYDGTPFTVDYRFLQLFDENGAALGGFEVTSVVYDSVIKAGEDLPLNLRYPKAVLKGGNGAEISSDNLEIRIKENDAVTVTVKKAQIRFSISAITAPKNMTEEEIRDFEAQDFSALVVVGGLVAGDGPDRNLATVIVDIASNQVDVRKNSRAKITNEFLGDVTDCYEFPRITSIITRV